MFEITLVQQTTALPHHLQYQEFQVQSYLKNQEVVPVENNKIKLNYLIQRIFSMFYIQLLALHYFVVVRRGGP